MIHLNKSPEPDVLRRNAAAWTKTLLDRANANEEPTRAEKSRYNHPEIKKALIRETYGKCAYCESKFGHLTYGDVEHIVAKTNNVRHYFEWTNLTVACDVCNTNKGKKDDILDPYSSDPEQMFRATGPMLLPRPEYADAVITDLSLKLNRPELIERRAERIHSLHKIVMAAKLTSNSKVSKAILDDLKANETLDAKEFAAVSRAYIKGLEAEGLI
jgi:uncharacterized protein (TIGR02646 family)